MLKNIFFKQLKTSTSIDKVNEHNNIPKRHIAHEQDLSISNRLSRVAPELVKLNRRYRRRHISECPNNIYKPFWIFFIGAQKEHRNMQGLFPETKNYFPENQKELKKNLLRQWIYCRLAIASMARLLHPKRTLKELKNICRPSKQIDSGWAPAQGRTLTNAPNNNKPVPRTTRPNHS